MTKCDPKTGADATHADKKETLDSLTKMITVS